MSRGVHILRSPCSSQGLYKQVNSCMGLNYPDDNLRYASLDVFINEIKIIHTDATDCYDTMAVFSSKMNVFKAI